MCDRSRAISVGSAAAATLVIALATGCGGPEREAERAEAAGADAHPSMLHGRITTVDGDTYEGRLRFGGDEEAFWGDYFNGFKDANPWVDHVPPGRMSEGRTIRFLGMEFERPGSRSALRRQLMVRFGDIAKIEARGSAVRLSLASGIELDPDARLTLESGVDFDSGLRVTLKSGTVVHLDRYAADDFADGVRVWDDTHGVVDLDEGQIRTIEFLPAARPHAAPPHRLHGTVRTRQGDFTGFLQWGREGSVGLDELTGHAAGGELLRLPFVAIRSIERRSAESARAMLLDGREVVLSGTRDVGQGSRGIYVDDPRYGRVLIPWDAFDRVDFSAVGVGPVGGGPAYDDFPIGRPLAGSVTTRAGRRLAGRLVFDLDESETTQTLDAPAGGVHYTIPFGLVSSVALPGRGGRATLTLRSGEELQLERSDDLGDGNAGILVFAAGSERAEYVSWADVERVDFGTPPRADPGVAAHRSTAGPGDAIRLGRR